MDFCLANHATYYMGSTVFPLEKGDVACLWCVVGGECDSAVILGGVSSCVKRDPRWQNEQCSWTNRFCIYLV